MGPEFDKLYQAFDKETILSMFSLLSEDVYMSLISDNTQPLEFRREWAYSLLLLWEHWNDQTIETAAQSFSLYGLPAANWLQPLEQ